MIVRVECIMEIQAVCPRCKQDVHFRRDPLGPIITASGRVLKPPMIVLFARAPDEPGT